MKFLVDAGVSNCNVYLLCALLSAKHKLSGMSTLNLKLINVLARDQKNASHLYSPGSYWESKAKRSYREILDKGIAEFRGSRSHICFSCGDNLPIDRRDSQKYSSPLKRIVYQLLGAIPKLSSMQDQQVILAIRYLNQFKKARSRYAEFDQEVRGLIKQLPKGIDTTSFGCEDTISIENVEYSCLYLAMLGRINCFSSLCDLKSASSFLEIGGGFGAFAHIILELFPNIKEYYYVDISPNLYVATKYLESFYGSQVVDYIDFKENKKQASSSRAIYCLPPWMLGRIPKNSIDIVHNASSFVEMPEPSVENYCLLVEELLASNGQILLQSYGNFNPSTTIHPSRLPKFFKNKNFVELRGKDVLDFAYSEDDYYFVST